MRAPWRPWPDRCERCGGSFGIAFRRCTMSYFNTDVVCAQCENDEKQAPGYAEARRVEEQHVRERDYRFPGVGLSPEAEVFLRERRAARTERSSRNGD